jgi:sugar phosphate isomerase/epimerase
VNPISFTTANLVARETGWAMHGWGHGDRLTNEAFRPLETYGERIDALLADVAGLGFRWVDVWGAHLGADWATDEHVELLNEALARHGLRVASYAAWVGPDTVRRACELTRALDSDLIGAGCSGDAASLAPVLRAGTLATTVDTGWWATQGYDPVAAIRELGPHVAHVHLKDVLAVGEPHETCPWGQGLVDVEACVRELQRLGYTGPLTVEHEPEDHDPSDEIRALREQLEAWLA